ncbi:MAG: putative bifunctional diguanylate cyclase/phosphodiesterase [Gammaproteobacteria bacterium]
MSSSPRDQQFNLALRTIDYSKYGWLVRAGLRGALAVVVCDLEGNRVWALAQNSQSSYVPALAALNDALPEWPHTGLGIRRCTVSDNTSAYITSICDSSKRPMGGLFVLIENDNKELEYNVLSSSIHRITNVLAVDIAKQAELDAMGDELLQRYEELNLIYNTQDNVKYFDEGQDALRKLVKRTSDYFDVSVCMVIMAERKLIIPHVNANAPVELDYDNVLQCARTEVYDQVSYRKKSLVHNGDAEHRHIFGDFDCKMLATPIFDENSEVIGAIVLANDLEAEDFTGSDKKLIGLMAHKASRIIQVNYDSLTGMMMRNGFEYHLETALYMARYKQVENCVLNINIDRLHVVNDTIGHHAGDELIKRVSVAIRDSLGKDDIVSRLGGGEFGVLLTGQAADDGEVIAQHVRAEVAKVEFSWDNKRYPVSVSIGLAPMEAETQSIISLLSFAELACSAAKELGRDRVQIYMDDNTMLIRRQAQVHWLSRLHTALREDQFQLFGQPIHPIGDTTRKHTEILVRLSDDEEGLMSPAEFISAAERYNLMPALDRWVVRNTLKMLMANLPASILNESTWAINLSGQTISDGNFLKFIEEEVKRTGINPSCLCFEITETAAVTNIRKVSKFMEQMKHQGFRFSLDDFGTGLSSFAYLKTLPVDYLKIDGQFVKEIETDRVSASMVSAIHQIGKEMGLKTIAEFVENQAIVDKLKSIGVNYAQGYHLGKPRPLMEQLMDFTSGVEASHKATGASDEEKASDSNDDTVVHLQVGG